MKWIFLSLGIVGFALIAYLFAIWPAARRHGDRKILDGLYIAHRGLHSERKGILENSIPAFRAAVKKGFAIENDIHLTKDGEIVVFHDDDLYRMCGVHGAPEEMTLSELKALRLHGTEERIPTLKECLDEIDGKTPLIIEFKVKSGSAEPICSAADAILKDYKGKYFIQSFYPFVLSWYKKNRPEICRGQLASSFKGEKLHRRMLGMMLFNFIARPDFISYDHTKKGAFGRKICTFLGAFPVGWTFRSAKELEDSKCDFKAYIFENFIPKNKG